MLRALCLSALAVVFSGCSQEVHRQQRMPAAPEAQTYSAYTIQVAAFRDRTQADRVVETLSEQGYTAWIAEHNPGDWHPWYRVCVGRFAMLREAQVTKQALLDNGFKESFVRAVR